MYTRLLTLTRTLAALLGIACLLGAALLLWTVRLEAHVGGTANPASTSAPAEPAVRSPDVAVVSGHGAEVQPPPAISTVTPASILTPSPSPTGRGEITSLTGMGAMDHTPTATPTSTTATPTPDGPATMNLLLLGIDQWEDGPGAWRSDTIIVARVDFVARSVALLSIPRDLWVPIPGFADNRINTAHFLGDAYKAAGGGPGLLRQTIEQNFGIHVDRHVRVDYALFKDVIGLLDGVTVDVMCPVQVWLPDAQAPEGWRPIQIEPGLHQMDAAMALQYVRAREGNSDFDRNRRQQAMIFTIWQRGLRLDMLPRVPELWASFRQRVNTDLTLPEVLRLARLASQLEPGRIRHLYIDRSAVEDWRSPEGAAVLRPNWERIQNIISEWSAPTTEAEQPPGPEARVAVFNATSLADHGASVAVLLRSLGYDAFETTAGPAEDRRQTAIVDLTGKPGAAERLASDLNLPADRIVLQTEPDSPIDLLVLAGRDVRPCAVR
jgi:LCP family protein required for cell wall assembly